MLTILGKVADPSKHIRILSTRDNTGFEIYFAEMAKKENYKD